MVAREGGVDEAFVVTEVEIRLAAVVEHEHLAVLEGGHRARVDVDVRVDLNARHAPASRQGLTLVHFSAQLEPCLTHENRPTHPKHPLIHSLNTGYTTPYVHPLSRTTRSKMS